MKCLEFSHSVYSALQCARAQTKIWVQMSPLAFPGILRDGCKGTIDFCRFPLTFVRVEYPVSTVMCGLTISYMGEVRNSNVIVQ